jgi:hypothetical protein
MEEMGQEQINVAGRSKQGAGMEAKVGVQEQGAGVEAKVWVRSKKLGWKQIGCRSCGREVARGQDYGENKSMGTER